MSQLIIGEMYFDGDLFKSFAKIEASEKIGYDNANFCERV